MSIMGFQLWPSETIKAGSCDRLMKLVSELDSTTCVDLAMGLIPASYFGGCLAAWVL